jgi:hypothetical protein
LAYWAELVRTRFSAQQKLFRASGAGDDEKVTQGLDAFEACDSVCPEGTAENSPTHHRKMTFQEEFLALLKKQHIEYDERYLWNEFQPSLRDLANSHSAPNAEALG